MSRRREYQETCEDTLSYLRVDGSMLWADSAFTRNSDTADITTRQEEPALLQRIGPPFIETLLRLLP